MFLKTLYPRQLEDNEQRLENESVLTWLSRKQDLVTSWHFVQLQRRDNKSEGHRHFPDLGRLRRGNRSGPVANPGNRDGRFIASDTRWRDRPKRSRPDWNSSRSRHKFLAADSKGTFEIDCLHPRYSSWSGLFRTLEPAWAAAMGPELFSR